MAIEFDYRDEEDFVTFSNIELDYILDYFHCDKDNRSVEAYEIFIDFIKYAYTHKDYQNLNHVFKRDLHVFEDRRKNFEKLYKESDILLDYIFENDYDKDIEDCYNED
ncbi:MAG: hypothetical protein EOL97_14650 [Spirochaetia bacterium]|nr:hypothetical protein [Spirochaetia bacterium]